MSERKPQTLEDVQVGDRVVIDTGRFGVKDCSILTVDRITSSLIIAEGDIRFRRKDGYRTPRGDWYTPKLVFGDEAEWLVRRCSRNRVMSSFIVACSEAKGSPKGIRTVRAACDAAEAALRELGEWVDE